MTGLAKLAFRTKIDEAEVALKGVLSLDVNLAGHEELRILGARASCLLQGALAALQKCKVRERHNGRCNGLLAGSTHHSKIPQFQTWKRR
ncbi:MAG: hypothetical protein DMG09_25070 [Acidobacteria bacterium]|nr:MAG: hypothetical protein DMG09_25070 [Acidobacteriota bacterium]